MLHYETNLYMSRLNARGLLAQQLDQYRKQGERFARARSAKGETPVRRLDTDTAISPTASHVRCQLRPQRNLRRF